jgi:hypothetical protein
MAVEYDVFAIRCAVNQVSGPLMKHIMPRYGV